MLLSKLIEDYKGQDLEINKITSNTKLVKQGDLFICIKGTKFDGHDLINEAIDNGAIFAITSKEMDISIPYLKVKDTFEYSIDLYQKYYENPQNKLKLIGVTGTDGKTTVTTIIQQLLTNSKCGYIGTNGYNCINYENINHVNTTPAPELMYEILSNFVENGCEYASLEASSEGFYYGRLNKLLFEVGIITNISSDHLNTHKTIENYIECKKNLVRQSKMQILNSNDKYFEQFKIESKNYYTYGHNITDDLYIKSYSLNLKSTDIQFIYENIEYNISSPLIGKFNVDNICAALLCLLKLGFKINDLLIRIPKLFIPGRMNFISNKKDITILLDYAHTTNALTKLFEFISRQDVNKMIVVFGKPGERDKQARHEIGPVLEKYNDLVILTAQDARSESVEDINKDILKNVNDISKFKEIVDRKKAIEYAINIAKPNDIVMVLGKGVENGLNINGSIIDHNDLEEIKKNI